MKKIILLLGMLLTAIPVVAEMSPTTITPVCQEWSLNAITLYVVGGATTTAATFDVTADSMTIRTTGGLYPGTTTFVFAETSKDTIGELVDFLNSVPVTTKGAEGGIVATVAQGCYDGDSSASLATHAMTNILGTSKAHMLALDSGAQFGISYVFPVTWLGDKYAQFHITGINTNVTYASGSAQINIYNGTKTTDAKLFTYKANATTVETIPASIPANGELAGTPGAAVRVDVVGTAAITAGYLDIMGYRK